MIFNVSIVATSISLVPPSWFFSNTLFAAVTSQCQLKSKQVLRINAARGFSQKVVSNEIPQTSSLLQCHKEQLPQEAQPEQGEKGNPGLYSEPEPQDRHPEH